MIYFVLAVCLHSQEAPSDPKEVKRRIQAGAPQSQDAPSGNDVDALREKLEALEREVERLKNRDGKAEGAKTATPAPERKPGNDPPNPQQSDAEKKRLEEEFKKALAGEDKAQAPPSPPPSRGGAATLRLIDLSFDILGAAGASTAQESDLRELEAGGHDPKNRGFTAQNIEMTFAGVVDPYLRGDANIVLQIDETGQTTIELEEAYLTAIDLPYNLQLRAGQFFTSFGRLNASHPHTWDFVDQPVINSRVMGPDGVRNPGAELSWLTPLPFFAELIGSVQNAQGPDGVSFRGTPGDVVAGRTLVGRQVQSLADILYLTRLRTSFDPTEEITLVPGISALFGPNATAQDTRTEIYGVDLYAKWKPLANDQGWPFVGWQTEALYRRYDAAAVVDAGIQVDRQRTLGDWGMYSQVVWGFARPWTMGFRYDFAVGQEDSFTAGGVTYRSSTDPLRDRRERCSLSLTYYPSEFSKVRIQYNYDRSEFLAKGDASSFYLQFEVLFGAHGAHKF